MEGLPKDALEISADAGGRRLLCRRREYGVIEVIEKVSHRSTPTSVLLALHEVATIFEEMGGGIALSREEVRTLAERLESEGRGGRTAPAAWLILRSRIRRRAAAAEVPSAGPGCST
ncbi:MAG: hypothetical protein IRY95_05335 [Clostridia bacterium]|nr:hypothetical protein [Clostridia bacterium]